MEKSAKNLGKIFKKWKKKNRKKLKLDWRIEKTAKN